MQCDQCKKDITFLYYIGRSNICNKCIGKYTVFKEVRNSEDALLRKALRAFDIKTFDDLKNVTEVQLDELSMGNIKEKSKQTLKYKKNKTSAVSVGTEDTLDYQTEYDTEYA